MDRSDPSFRDAKIIAPGGKELRVEDLSGEDPIVDLVDLHLNLESAAGTVNILKGVDLRVQRQETVSIVGPSGSGKTSMLMIIAGLENPSQGQVRVAGHDLAAIGEDALARFRRDHVGIVFQNFHLVPTMTALENVAIPLEFAGRRDAFTRSAEMLGAVGLGHRVDHYPGQLSGGEQQRVALARAFAGQPDLILADEPTGNLGWRNGPPDHRPDVWSCRPARRHADPDHPRRDTCGALRHARAPG